MEQVTQYCLTCESSPSQWEGKLASGLEFYIRYRFGVLTVCIFPTGQLEQAYDNPVKRVTLGDDLDGYLSDEAMRQHTEDHCDWSQAEKVPYEEWRTKP